MNETYRLFIAVELPTDVLDALGKTQSDLKQTIPSRMVRWTRTEGVHLTLKFLGDVASDRVGDLQDGLITAISGHEPFSLSVEGLGCFPDSKRPRVIWIGVTGDIPRLAALQKSVEQHIALLGFPTENRLFTPHLTLGRIKNHTSRDDIARAGRIVEEYDLGMIARWRVESISLMRSQLKPDGAVYMQLLEAKLGS
ncbi:MAG: RNA 2',3'-cyclic phosphodiesterase [Anaerolineae bacterium]|nr:RNA 2',3'-cyclic phosphodiesterase [Anaerolineae bacterium]